MRKDNPNSAYLSVSEFLNSEYFTLEASKEGNIIKIANLEVGDLNINVPQVKVMLENSLNNLLYERRIAGNRNTSHMLV